MKPKVIFLHCRNPKNTGDMASCLFDVLQFPQRDKLILDISDREPYKEPELTGKDTVIVGGGGLLGYHPVWDCRISNLLKSEAKVVLLGAGMNFSNPDYSNKFIPDATEFFQFRSRDYAYGINSKWCPCPSILRLPEPPKPDSAQKVGIITHYEMSNKHWAYSGSRMTNSAPLEEIVDFICSHSIIFSDSYHMILWAQMLGKLVVRLDNSFDIRFAMMIEPPLGVTSMDEAIRKSQVLWENREFFRARSLRNRKLALEAVGKAILNLKELTGDLEI